MLQKAVMSSSEPPYSLLYEDWLLKSRQVARQIAETPDHASSELCLLAGQSLLIRAGIAGTLQLAGQETMGRAWIESEAESVTQQKAFSAMHLDEEALDRLRPLNQQDDDDDGPIYRCRDSDIDAFFAAYPSALRSPEDDSDDDESMDEGGCDGDDGLSFSSTMKRRADVAVSAKQQELGRPSSKDQIAPISRTGIVTSDNPYDTNNQQAKAQAPAISSSASFYATIDYPQQYPQHQHQNHVPPPHGYPRDRSNGASWSNSNPLPEPRGNPFQTASDLARAENAHPLPQPPVQQHQQSGFNPYANQPYGSHNGPQSPPPPPAPVIRESLKRKYQPPIKKATVPAQNASSSNDNLGSVRHQASTKQQADPTATSRENESDDDELPEPLQRFGKELVQKIRDEIMDVGENVTFDDIAGLADAKQTVQEVVCWPMKRPDLFTGLRRAPNGLLLFGPPGTGKTLIGKAIAFESGATFFSISSSSLTSKWIGEGEKLVRTLFAVAAYYEPSVVFIDEIDSLLTQRKADENEASRRIKTEFLVQLDGTGTGGQGRVLMIGATNRPQELDEAARRRFTKRLYIPLPEELDREALLRVLLAKNKHELGDSEIQKIAKDTSGYSGADLKALCADAAMGPIRALGARALEVDCNEVPAISYKHFRQSLRSMNPSVAPGDLDQYLAWDSLYGNQRALAGAEEDDDDLPE